MKFSHSIQLNSTPEWLDSYINYSRLKKVIYDIEKATLGQQPLPTQTSLESSQYKSFDHVGDAEEEARLLESGEAAPMAISQSQTPFNRASIEDSNAIFCSFLDSELTKIVQFYACKETELVNDIFSVETDIKAAEDAEESLLLHSHEAQTYGQSLNRPLSAPPQNNGGYSPTLAHNRPPAQNKNNSSTPINNRPSSTSMEDSVTIDPFFLLPSGVPSYFINLMWTSASLKHRRASIATRLTDLYVALCELAEFVELNETGFSKVLKKYDKVVGCKLKISYLPIVERSYPFLSSTKRNLTRSIDHVTLLYARIATEGKTTGILHLTSRIFRFKNTSS